MPNLQQMQMMKKFFLFTFLVLSLHVSAQFKFGGALHGGVTNVNEGTVKETYDFIGGGGFYTEFTGAIGLLRAGYVFQSGDRQLVPLQACIRFGRTGVFAGGGVSLAANTGSNYYDIILGKKFHRNGDFSLVYSKPYDGLDKEPIYAFRITFFPFTTCGDACPY